MSDNRVTIDVIVIPKVIDEEDATLLSSKLRQLGEKAKILGMLTIPKGTHHPDSKIKVDGTQLILNGTISASNRADVQRFVKENYDGDLYEATAYGFYQGIQESTS